VNPPCQRLIHDAAELNTGVWPTPTDELVTPVGLFFTRSHAAVPQIDLAAWRLEIGGLVHAPRSFSMDELTGMFPRRRVTSTLVCAGLRRQEFLRLGPLPGELPWGPEAASTGCWTGVALRDLLDAVGVAPHARHVEFVGLDRVERLGQRFGFGGSIDLAKALAPEVLLAWDLNGAPLTPAHGFPLRAIVPGWLGARSVKWLGRITLLEEHSSNYFQQKAYRLQREVHPHDPRDVSAGTYLKEVPLNAVILGPVADQVLPAGPVRVHGWALGASGHSLTAVMLSPDNGHTWTPADVSLEGKPWTWSFWEATLNLTPGRHTLVVQARDKSGASQPAAVSSAWNVKGYCNNAWHRVTIEAA
jgi:sulfite oxidase